MTIIYNIDFFGASSIHIHDGEHQRFEGYADISQAPAAITELCHKKNIYDVLVIGNTNFACSIAAEIEQYNMKKYSNNRKIKVEVM